MIVQVEIDPSLWQTLPTMQGVLNEFRAALLEHSGILLVTPARLDSATVWRVLSDEFYRAKRLEWHLDLARLAGARPFRDVLRRELLDGVTNMAAPSLYGWADRPLIVFDGFDALDASERLECLELFDSWKRRLLPMLTGAPTSRPGIPPGFLAIIPTGADRGPVPRSSEDVRVFWCWGMLSSLEMTLLQRELQRDALVDDALAAAWAEQLLPALVGDDLRFFEHLRAGRFETGAELALACRAYAAQLGWDADPSRIVDAQQALSRLEAPRDRLFCRLAPPDPVRVAWEAGLLCATREYGWELHTAALVAGQLTEEFTHRLWRGQVAWLMPILDRSRIAICDWLAREFDPHWPSRWPWVKPQNIEDWEELCARPRSAEWGYLALLWKRVAQLKDFRAMKEAVIAGRRLRNNLAHYEPVTYAMVRDFLQAARQARLPG